MQTFRSLATIEATQYTGIPIPDITCHGEEEKFMANGCDASRRYVPHVHSRAVGGMTALKAGDWIIAEAGGPFKVIPDPLFRAQYEVAAPVTAPRQAGTAQILRPALRTGPQAAPAPPHGTTQILRPALRTDSSSTHSTAHQGIVTAPVRPPLLPEVQTAYYTDGSSKTGPAPLPAFSDGGAPMVSREHVQHSSSAD
jgi:hypothetical protein